MELLSKGTILSVADTNDGEYKRLYGLKSTPDMGGDTESVDVTNLSDTSKRSIAGLADPGDMEFGFYVNQTDDSQKEQDALYDNYLYLRQKQIEGKELWFKLEYPDGFGFMWRGSVSVKRGGAEVGAALAFTLKTRASSEMTDIMPQEATAAASEPAEPAEPTEE